MRKSLTIAFVYTTVILGAGFASGRELSEFFVKFGAAGIVGLLIAGLLFSFVGYAVLDICRTNKISDYNLFMDRVMGKRIGTIVELAVVLFMFILYATMLSASASAIRQAFNLPFTAMVIVSALACFVLLLFDLDGLVAFNARLAPFMIAGTILIGIYAFVTQTVPTSAISDGFTGPTSSTWWFSACVYASYNIVTAISVLAAMGHMVSSQRDAAFSGIMGGVMMTVLGLFLCVPLFQHKADIMNTDIPILAIVTEYGTFFEYMYLLLLLCAILTTAISNAFTLSRWLNGRYSVKPIYAKLAVTALASVFAHVGFSVFVSKVYPLFAAAGAIEIIYIVKTHLGGMNAKQNGHNSCGGLGADRGGLRGR